ncbi:MAG TPA: protein YgfX [Rhodanobacteraceae bacterium]|nr:protein YgfX [Rhodanobacteraceae bacterium]
MKQAPAIGFTSRASWLLVIATLVVGLLALVAVQLVRGPAWLHHVLHLAIVAYVAAVVAGMLRPRVKALVWREDGTTDITLRDGVVEDGRTVQGAVGSARVLGPLIVLTLRWPPRERAHLWLLPDNLDADTRRRLRMRLGAEAAGATASGNADSH